MNEVLVIILTAVPVCAGGVLGYRIGLLRLLRIGTPIIGAWALAWYVGSTGLNQGWFLPFGLSTPLLAAALACLAGWLVLGRIVALVTSSRKPAHPDARRPATPYPAPRGSRRRSLNGLCGAVLGGSFGLLVAASVWLLLFLLAGLMAPAERTRVASLHAPSGKVTWARSLLRTANRGFVRHLPVLGSLGDELEGVVMLLNSEPRAREELAGRHGLVELAELPSFRAIVEDPVVLEEIEALRGGNIAALYRLQKSPLILRFFEEEDVQKAITGLSASSLARELEEIEAAEHR